MTRRSTKGFRCATMSILRSTIGIVRWHGVGFTTRGRALCLPLRCCQGTLPFDHPLLITKGILRNTMGTLHALVSLPLQLSTIAQRLRINLRSRRQAASNSGLCQDALFGTLVLGPGFSTRGNDCLLLNGLVRNGFLVGNGLLGIRGHGGWARNKVCDIRGNFGGNGGLGINLDRRALCVFIPNSVGIR